MAHDTSVISRINALLGEVGNGQTKRASEMSTSGSASKDPGGYQGASSHPSARVDAMTQSSPMGARAKENEKDVKEDHPGGGVDNTSPESGGDQDSHQFNIGTVQSATGEQPSVEDDYKGDKEDPGTSHPANADDVGEKYSSMKFRPLLKLAFDKMNGVVADIANGNHISYYQQVTSKQAAQNGHAQNGQQKQAAQNGQLQIDEAGLAANAGYELADHVLRQESVEKQAAAQQVIEQTIRDAEHDADLVGEFLHKYAGHRQKLHKRAMDPAAGAEGEDHIPPEMVAAMSGGGGDPSGGGDPAAGGGDPAAVMGGGDPAGAMGGGDPAGGAGGDHEAAINELFNALAQMGIPPEEILAAAQQAQGGGGGGEGSGEGGDEGGAKMGSHLSPLARHMAGRLSQNKEAAAELAQLTYATCAMMKAGRARIRRVEPNTKEAKERSEIVAYIKEVCGLR